MNKAALLLIFSIFLFACKKDDKVTIVDLGYDYYPDNLGYFKIYECDSLVYHDAPTSDTIEYFFQIKEKIDSLLIDNQGRRQLRISRYKKLIRINNFFILNPTFTLQDVWWANKTETTVEVVEENERFVKLAFPVQLNKTWNGNAYNTNPKLDYNYISIDEPLTLGTLTFAKALTVKQLYSEATILYYKKYQEKYARSVGMVYKDILDYTWKQNINGVQIGQIQYGLYYKMQLIQSGIE